MLGDLLHEVFVFARFTVSENRTAINKVKIQDYPNILHHFNNLKFSQKIQLVLWHEFFFQ